MFRFEIKGRITARPDGKMQTGKKHGGALFTRIKKSVTHIGFDTKNFFCKGLKVTYPSPDLFFYFMTRDQPQPWSLSLPLQRDPGNEVVKSIGLRDSVFNLWGDRKEDLGFSECTDSEFATYSC